MANLISDYGLPAIFLLVFLEYACFPVSSEIVLPLAGLLGAGYGLAFAPLVLLCSACGLGGTLLTYIIGRLGGSPLLEKIIKRFPAWEKPVLASYRTFGDHGKSAVFLSRLIPLCRTYIGFVAGAMKQPLLSYVICSSLGILLWNTVLTSLGYYFYQYRGIFFSYFDKYKRWIFLIGSLLLLIIFLRLWFRSKTKTKDSKENQNTASDSVDSPEIHRDSRTQR